MRILCMLGWFGFLFLAIVQSSKSFNFISSDQSKLSLALSFQKSAERCLLDIRDKNTSFIASKDCGSLGALSLAYVSAWGRDIDESSHSHFIYIEGLKTAWSAAALSNANYGTKVISLW